MFFFCILTKKQKSINGKFENVIVAIISFAACVKFNHDQKIIDDKLNRVKRMWEDYIKWYNVDYLSPITTDIVSKTNYIKILLKKSVKLTNFNKNTFMFERAKRTLELIKEYY